MIPVLCAALGRHLGFIGEKLRIAILDIHWALLEVQGFSAGLVAFLASLLYHRFLTNAMISLLHTHSKLL